MGLRVHAGAADGARMMFSFVKPKRKQRRLRPMHLAIAGLAALIGAGDADARGGRSERAVESRIASEPIMAIVSLQNQRITIYDANGWILRAPVSSGQKGRETPPGFSALSKRKPSTTRICMTMPTCPTCNASLGRASRFTVELCPDIRHHMAACECPSI